MSHNPILDSCTIQLHAWKPFHVDNLPDPTKPYSKRPCLSDRATSSFSVDTLDISKLSLHEDDRPTPYNRPSYRLIAKKRRRRGSRSVSGRSSDKSGTRRCCSVGAQSDIAVAAVGTDSSGELFGDGNSNCWDVNEVRNSVGRREEREREREERERLGVFGSGDSVVDGYGSEPGYRGDGEFGYGDEIDEDDDDGRVLFWGGGADYNGGTDPKMEMVGENIFSDQKAHYRCRRKKHDCRMVYSLR